MVPVMGYMQGVISWTNFIITKSVSNSITGFIIIIMYHRAAISRLTDDIISYMWEVKHYVGTP